MQRRIEGTAVAGRRVLVVEDTSTTGKSPLAAVEAVREAGADVVGVATIVDRDTGARELIENAGLRSARFAVSGWPISALTSGWAERASPPGRADHRGRTGLPLAWRRTDLPVPS